ncbi:MAG: hypothetical protein DF168_02125 [Candidatus Moanabacter tarae]|uniref:Amidohydrolase-related domain-containing protein n=1 Tax=Candidatus Moanibacter tarae TaxID=2200854 RepID=A0A2Z4ANB7_9BACT|nr:MAG: hypothetical protein DF168_02125 [Candidatus Moanabacter tarae]|tara:strand:- start:296320 stop:297270 length:951 start_codon:yes stop_codon:yes gene_type:complete
MKSKNIRSPHPPRIDAHVHVFARASRQFPREVSDLLPATREEPVEKLLDQMQANGVSQAVLVQIGGASFEHHSYLRYCLETYPRQFLGIGLIPTDELKPEEHMDRLATNGDVIGFRLSSIGGPADPLAPMDIRSFRTFPIWKHAAERDYVIWLYPQAIDAHCLPFIIEAFPEVRVVFNHMLALPGKGSFSWDSQGRPRVEFTALPPPSRYSTMGLHQFENVSVHLSGQYAFSNEEWPYRDLKEWHERLYRPHNRKQGFGANRLLWATDFPWITENPGYERLTQIIEELLPDLNEDEISEIMGGTAQRLLRFPEAPT